MRGSNEKEKFWREQLRLADRYSGTQAEFCRSHGFSLHTFQYWRSKLRRARPTVPVVAQPFVQIEVERVTPALPDPRWVAELIHHLHQGGAR